MSVRGSQAHALRIPRESPAASLPAAAFRLGRLASRGPAWALLSLLASVQAMSSWCMDVAHSFSTQSCLHEVPQIVLQICASNFCLQSTVTRCAANVGTHTDACLTPHRL